ncbi:hypothetical protein TTRE_0000647001 [Trichuris trichiura]|uniref:Uncharacterized protein n=1 Tax=Trichuris trichiura TaxID=36087 RepID=A0A077ZHU4_TRITR|nr:hypothetical protein TTRE_0000647001 [Trichuris trichiura]
MDGANANVLAVHGRNEIESDQNSSDKSLNEESGRNFLRPLQFQTICQLDIYYTLMDCSASFLADNPFWPDIPFVPLWSFRVASQALNISAHCYNVLTNEIVTLANLSSLMFPLPPRACGHYVIIVYVSRYDQHEPYSLSVIHVLTKKLTCFVIKGLPPKEMNSGAICYPEASITDGKFHLFRRYSHPHHLLEMHHFEVTDRMTLQWVGSQSFLLPGEGVTVSKLVHFPKDRVVYSVKSEESEEIDVAVTYHFGRHEFKSTEENFSNETILRWIASGWAGGKTGSEMMVSKNNVYCLKHDPHNGAQYLRKAKMGPMSLKMLALQALASFKKEAKYEALLKLSPFARRCGQYIMGSE